MFFRIIFNSIKTYIKFERVIKLIDKEMKKQEDRIYAKTNRNCIEGTNCK